jgi:serine/threonine-protein kinase
MLFSADEVAAGTIDHAIRFILPNPRIRDNVYVHPGTHSTGPTAGGPDAPPYGVRFRLRADYPLDSLPNEASRVVARALQKYGMFLADAGQIALTAQSDRFTTNKWSDVGLAPQDLAELQVTDFEVVDMGDPIVWSGDCVLNPP